MTNTTLKKIDDRLDGLDPESLRARVLMALRRFRAGWIDLGRMLNEIAYGGDYKEWGYDDFELYCARELGLKKPTVQKLMVSYNYMKSNEPQRLRDFEDAPPNGPAPSVPDYQTVELLSRARQRPDLGDEVKEDFHRRAFSPDTDGDEEENGLRRELRQRLKPPSTPPWEEGADGPDAGEAGRRELTGIVRLARELRKRLAATTVVPEELRDQLTATLSALEAL